MNKVQKQVAMDMVARGAVHRQKYSEGILKPITDSSGSGLLESVAQNWEERNEEWLQMTVEALMSISLHGRNGLKHRSGLMEYRYDS